MLYIEDDQEGIAVISGIELGVLVLVDQQEPLFDSGPAAGTDQPVGIRRNQYREYARATSN